MFNPKEFGVMIFSAIIIALAIGFFRGISEFPLILASVFFVILLNILGKKIAGFYLDSRIEIKSWKIERYGFKPKQYFKTPIPAGLIFPILFSLISFGKFIWMASFSFDVKPEISRVAKRYNLYSYSEMTEGHIGMIAAAGVIVNIIFAIIGYLIGFSEFSRLNIYFAFFSLIPLSELDGNKIFFGNFVLWCFLSVLVLIGLAYSFLLI